MVAGRGVEPSILQVMNLVCEPYTTPQPDLLRPRLTVWKVLVNPFVAGGNRRLVLDRLVDGLCGRSVVPQKVLG